LHKYYLRLKLADIDRLKITRMYNSLSRRERKTKQLQCDVGISQ